jgi:two-component system sensor histidine kinase ChvG
LPFAGWIILGVLYLSQYHAWLIDAKRESLRAQGEIIAAAIAANVSVETGRMVLDPEQLPELDGPWTPFRDDAIDALHLSLVPERLTPILRKLVSTLDTRARIYRRDGTLISDTANFGFVIPAHREDSEIGRRRAEIRNAWDFFLSWMLREKLPVYREIDGANGTSYPEVRMALSGSTTPLLLVTDNGEQIVSVAVPIQQRKAVQGVLLLSTRPGEIDAVQSEERNTVFVLFGLCFLLIALVRTFFRSRDSAVLLP